MIDDEPFNLEDYLANCTQTAPRAQEMLTFDRLREVADLLKEDSIRSPDEHIYRYGLFASVPDTHIDSFRFLATAIPASYAATWTVHPKTYEFIRFAHAFPQPTRKLRKVQIRRIAARKRAWRAHCARMRVNRSFL